MLDNEKLGTMILELFDRTTESSTSTKSAHHRLDKHDKHFDKIDASLSSMHKIATSVETLTLEVKHAVGAFTNLCNQFDEVKKEVQEIKNRPAVEAKKREDANRYALRNAILYTSLGALVSGLVGAAIWIIGAMSGYHYYAYQYYN